jgi:RNA polymerase sigma-70 factor (ECF subfamily)
MYGSLFRNPLAPFGSKLMDHVKASGNVLASEGHLLARAVAGEREAYGLLVERHQDAVVKALCYLVGDRDEAEDLAQEVFIRAYRGLAAFKGSAAFSTWLYRIVHNVSASHYAYRKAKKRNAPLVSLDAGEGGDGVPGPPAEPGDRAERDELREAIASAVRTLPDDMREFVVLRDMEDRSYEEISEIVGAPLGTVKSRIHRARLLLREKLKRFL